MKWFYTFTVVGAGGLRDELEQNCASVIEGHMTVRDIENRLHEALKNEVRSVAFFRALMDSHGETHRELAFWTVSMNPGIFTDWRLFVTYGVLATTTTAAPRLGASVPAPSAIAKAAKGAGGLNAHSFLDAFFDAAQITRASHGLLVMTARVLGASVDLKNYG